MSFDPLDSAAREQAAKAERRQQQVAAKQFRADVQEVMALPAMRRVLAQFFEVSGLDRSVFRPLNPDPVVMTFAAGWQDAGRWWIDAIREHCPEREVQLRAEAKREAREGATNEADDGPE